MSETTLRQDDRLEQPPKVTAHQWVLSYLLLGLAGLGFLTSSYEALVILAELFVLVDILLLIILGKEALRTRSFGKLLLVASTLLFFWLEALRLALKEIPFPTPGGLPFPSAQYGEELVRQAYLYVALFQLMLLVGYSLRPRMRAVFDWIGSRVKSRKLRARVMPYVLAGCAVFPLLLALRFNLKAMFDVLVAARTGAEVEMDNVGLLHFLTFFGMYGAAILLAEAVLVRSKKRLWSLIFGGIAALPFIMSGARHLWLFVAFPAFILMSRSEQRLTFSRLLRWAAVSLALILILQLQFSLRNEGWGEVANVESSQLLETDVTGQFGALLFAQYLVPERHDYFLEVPEKYFVIHWIPRQFWPDKPVMQSWEFYNGEYTQGGAFNVTPSIIGQYHMSFGFFGVVFIGIWLGFLTRLADRALLVIELERQLAMAIAIGMFYAFIISSFRFYSPIYFAYFLFAMIGMMLLTSHRRRASAARPGEVDAYRPLQYPGVS